MTSKNLFFNLMKEDIKRRLWAAALTFLFFFFSLPVATAVALGEKSYRESDGYQKMVYSVQSILGLGNGFVAVFIVILALILGVNSFSWLHSRKKVDFYHSLPVRREMLFFVDFLDGILIMAGCYLVNLGLGMIAAMVNGVAPADILPAVLTAAAFFLLHFAMLYSVSVLAMVLTGHMLVGILGIGVFHLYFPALIFMIEALYMEFFVTRYNGGNGLAYLLIDKCSALTLYIGNHDAIRGSTGAGPIALRMASVVLVTVVITGISLLLYRKRGSEAAGKAMAFRISRPIIRIPIVILSALAGGLFFWYMRDGLGWAVFGIICGLLLSHCTIEIIYHFDFKKLFHGRVSMAVCAAAAIAVFCGFRFDLFGYDSYIPARSSLESVAVSLSDMDYWVDYGEVKKDRDGNYYWDYQNSDTYMFSHMKLSDMDTPLALVSESVRQMGADKWNTQVWDEDRGPYSRFFVKYTLKNGREVYRSYTVYGDTSYALVKKLYDSPQYRMAVYPVMVQTPEETGKIKVSQNSWSREVTRGKSRDGEDYVDLILRTYQEEMAALTSDVMEQENPVGRIQFMTVNQTAAEAASKGDTSPWRSSNVINKGQYPVYPSFKETIGLLKECGIELNRGFSEGTVVKAELDLWDLVETRDKSYNYEGSSQITITDSEELSVLTDHARLENYSNMNPFSNSAGRVNFEVTVQGESGQVTNYCSIPKDKVPEHVKQEAERFWQDAVSD